MKESPFAKVAEDILAETLAREGESMDKELSEDLKHQNRFLKGQEIIAMAIVDSMSGADYAVDKFGYMEMAFKYIMSGDTKILTKVGECTGRFGEENLRNALISWKNLFDIICEGCDVKKCSIDKLKAFQPINGIETIEWNLEESCPFAYVIRVIGGQRDNLMNYLKERKIGSEVYYIPNHLHPYFHTNTSLPTTERLWQEILALPFYCDLKENDVSHVIASVRSFFGRA